MPDFVADFTLEQQPTIEANLTLGNQNPIDAELKIDVQGVTEHNLLNNRDLPDQHPISAITGLQTVVNKIPEIEQELSGKQDQLNAQQLNAVNSGITAEGVEKINNSVQSISVENGLEVSRIGQDVTILNPSFVFEQAIASDTWVITHNLGKRPTIILVDSSGRQFEAERKYINNNQVVVKLEYSTTGFAYLN